MCDDISVLCGQISIKVGTKVQKRATKLIPGLKNMVYSERLKLCKLPTLHYRQIRGDMIELYKILSGKYDVATTPHVSKECNYSTRGNDLREKQNKFA